MQQSFDVSRRKRDERNAICANARTKRYALFETEIENDNNNKKQFNSFVLEQIHPAL